ncbi:GGDEF domain-containing protein [Devosia sp.]|uniref:GGDEF domain-containing protein n=1 Tax=Devosia sp. TaxID=1871048 RepID=UPI001ACD0336|nr:GGDEF domain-containing protein [Devosia sp.]MBN9335712.1 GGDEF domain-containing protein [Devosia sp.]
MTGLETALPKQAWLWIYRKTLLIMGVSVAASVVATVVFMGTFSAGVNLPGLVIAIILPIALGGPMTLIFAIGTEKMRHANDQLGRLATLDGLTGLFNRRAFTAAVEKHCASPHRQGVLLVIDADHFKSVNDRFGHDQGDEALRDIAHALELTVGRRGLSGRLGGEEFGVYLPDADLGRAEGMADEIRRSINHIDFTPEGVACPLSVSIGGAYHNRPAPFRELYRAADEWLYSAKQQGRDRVALPQAA